MTYGKEIMVTFIRIGIAGVFAVRRRVGKTFFTTGQHFMNVGLMGYVKYKFIF